MVDLGILYYNANSHTSHWNFQGVATARLVDQFKERF